MIDPFKIIEPTCISFSGGRTSAYMLWRVLQSHGGILPAEAIVCFANTGKEDEATLRFVQACSDNWSVPIAWIEFQQELPKYKVVNFETAARNGEPFEALITKKSYLPNPVARFCTEELKVSAINRYLADVYIDFTKDSATMVGVRADEPRRLPKLRARGLLVPLADAGVTQHDVQSFWHSQTFDLGLTFRNGVTALGNCDLCFLKGTDQIIGLIKDDPSRATWWAKQEIAIGATFRSDRASYGQMQTFMDKQGNMFNNDGGIDCFCGD
jgi:3'-phosphoadenosine 5'-phosphosulfate sulfotransferase (PAPS reductase)/FAD synthetase